MPSTRPAIWMTTALLLGISAVFAQDTPAPDAPTPLPAQPAASPAKGHRKAPPREPTPEENILAIRQMLEEQALKVEAINQQVIKLSNQVNTLGENLANLKASPPQVLPATAATGSTTTSAPAEAPASNAQAVNAPSALITGSTAIHVVTKGETLTSIARHNKVTVAELLKLNKIENDRALQIGQTLVLPTPKPVDTPNEPK